MALLDIGDGSSAAPDMVQFGVRPGDTVVVSNLSTSSSAVNVFANGIDQTPTSVAVNANLSISTVGPFWLQAASGVATVQVTGGLYGAV